MIGPVTVSTLTALGRSAHRFSVPADFLGYPRRYFLSAHLGQSFPAHICAGKLWPWCADKKYRRGYPKKSAGTENRWADLPNAVSVDTVTGPIIHVQQKCPL